MFTFPIGAVESQGSAMTNNEVVAVLGISAGSAASSIFGSEFNTAESLARSTTTSTTFQFKLNLNVTVPAGDYVIKWAAAIGNIDEEVGVGFRVEQDNTTELINVRPQVGREVLTEWSHNPGGHAIVTLSGTHDFDIDFQFVAGEGDVVPAFIEDARLTLWRVT